MRKYIALLFVLLPLAAIAQDEEADFTADRPGVTNSVDVLPMGRVQWETGIGFERSKLDGPAVNTWTPHTSTLRWGFSDYAELRLQGSWLYESCEGAHTSGLSDVAIGTKVKLFDGWKAVPKMALLANIFVPDSHSPYLPTHWGGQVSLAFQNELAPWLSLGYEGNMTWCDDARPAYYYGAYLCFTLSDRWLLLTDAYHIHATDGSESWVQLGAAYQLTDRLQLDMSTDISLNHPNRYGNLNVGISWQITKK
jgi:hypothetical protein